jgi:hypothetical protein
VLVGSCIFSCSALGYTAVRSFSDLQNSLGPTNWGLDLPYAISSRPHTSRFVGSCHHRQPARSSQQAKSTNIYDAYAPDESGHAKRGQAQATNDKPLTPPPVRLTSNMGLDVAACDWLERETSYCTNTRPYAVCLMLDPPCRKALSIVAQIGAVKDPRVTSIVAAQRVTSELSCGSSSVPGCGESQLWLGSNY